MQFSLQLPLCPDHFGFPGVSRDLRSGVWGRSVEARPPCDTVRNQACNFRSNLVLITNGYKSSIGFIFTWLRYLAHLTIVIWMLWRGASIRSSAPESAPVHFPSWNKFKEMFFETCPEIFKCSGLPCLFSHNRSSKKRKIFKLFSRAGVRIVQHFVSLLFSRGIRWYPWHICTVNMKPQAAAGYSSTNSVQF